MVIGVAKEKYGSKPILANPAFIVAHLPEGYTIEDSEDGCSIGKVYKQGNI